MALISVVGTRPQYIKAAILCRKMPHEVIDTGQHYDRALAGQYFAELALSPRTLPGGGDVASMYRRLLDALEPADTVLVYGDCNTTLAAALAARRLEKRLVHIEAGCRSFNRRMIEEGIRVTVDHLADLALAPSPSALDNLRAERIAGVFAGDLSQDYIDGMESAPEGGPPLVTIHRAENLENMETIASILGSLGTEIVWPQHPKMRRYPVPGNVRRCEPVPFGEMLRMVRAAPYIITDSGGLQKEAYMLRTQCITLREDTEWPDTLAGGWNTLAGVDGSRVLSALRTTPGEWRAGLFGSGVAREIARQIERIR